MSIAYLELLEPEPRLQHGIAFMIWNTFLKTSFENLINMIYKNDKELKEGHKVLGNKDRILRRDVFVVESDLVSLFYYFECLFLN